MKRPDRAGAATYLADHTEFTPEQVLADVEVMEAAFALRIAGHESCGCEAGVRLRMVRDVLIGAPLPGRLL